jgi:hypothetical protein
MADKIPFEPRDRTRPLKTFVSPKERVAIETRAQAAGLSVSAYLRAAALGVRLTSVHDQKAILALLQLNADQGRLGGLLKLWLVSRAGVGAGPGEVRRLLRDIETVQIQLRALIDRL